MCMQLMRYYVRLKIEFDSQLSFSRMSTASRSEDIPFHEQIGDFVHVGNPSHGQSIL